MVSGSEILLSYCIFLVFVSLPLPLPLCLSLFQCCLELLCACVCGCPMPLSLFLLSLSVEHETMTDTTLLSPQSSANCTQIVQYRSPPPIGQIAKISVSNQTKVRCQLLCPLKTILISHQYQNVRQIPQVSPAPCNSPHAIPQR